MAKRNIHPAKQGSWVTHRFDARHLRCELCEGPVSDLSHERLWDDIRRLAYPNGGVSFISMPAWFPADVCENCADFVTPYVVTAADIGLLKLYATRLQGIVSNGKVNENERTSDHWPVALIAGYCRELCDRWVFGDREGNDAAQAIEEHQRQPLFRDEDCNVPA